MEKNYKRVSDTDMEIEYAPKKEVVNLTALKEEEAGLIREISERMTMLSEVRSKISQAEGLGIREKKEMDAEAVDAIGADIMK